MGRVKIRLQFLTRHYHPFQEPTWTHPAQQQQDYEPTLPILWQKGQAILQVEGAMTRRCVGPPLTSHAPSTGLWAGVSGSGWFRSNAFIERLLAVTCSRQEPKRRPRPGIWWHAPRGLGSRTIAHISCDSLE